MTRVCYVAHMAEMDGAGRALFELVVSLRALGIEGLVLAPGPGSLIDAFAKAGVPARVVRYTSWAHVSQHPARYALLLPYHLLGALAVAREARRAKCDLVYTNTLVVCVGAFAAALLRKPHLWHLHEFGDEDHGFHFDLGRRLSFRIMDRLTARFIVISQAVREKFVTTLAPSKILTVYQSVTVPGSMRSPDSRNRRTPADPFVCTILGKVSPTKGYEDAVRAMAKLTREGFPAVLRIVGEPDSRFVQRLRALVAQLGVGESVEIQGPVDDAFEVLDRSDVVLVCSRAEAFGRVAVEAMTLGKPVIGTAAGGTLELIQDGVNGFLYSAGDAQELARKIRVLMDDPARGMRMSEAARSWAAGRFTSERYGREVAAILREVVSADQRSHEPAEYAVSLRMSSRRS